MLLEIGLSVSSCCGYVMLLSLVFVYIVFAVLHTFLLWHINSQTGESRRVLTTVFAGDLKASI